MTVGLHGAKIGTPAEKMTTGTLSSCHSSGGEGGDYARVAICADKILIRVSVR